MKTILRNILVVALMFGTLVSYAQLKKTSPVKKGDLLSVYNERGKMIYSDYADRTGDYQTMFDFSKLNDGIYTVEINKSFAIDINAIEVNNHNVSLLNNPENTIHKPVFRMDQDRVLISKLALDSKKMKVELYYENDLIYSETATGNEIINRVYKLDGKEHGNYTAIMKADGRTYIENFRI